MIPFSKWQGCGNDFVLLLWDDLVRAGMADQLSPAWIAFLCDRRFGIGSDGLITLEKTSKGLICLMWNPDGSSSGMCGNGIRCAAMHAAAKGLWQSGDPFWMSDRLVRVIAEGDEVLVGMGQPSGDPWDPTRTDIAPTRFGLDIGDQRVDLYGVSFGNPHLVALADDIDTVKLHQMGPLIERHPNLPGSSNVHFVQPIGRTAAKALHWERGAGATLACGSGASAIFTVLRHMDLCEKQLALTVPGGRLVLSDDEDGVWKKGPASESFTGWTLFPDVS